MIPLPALELQLGVCARISIVAPFFGELYPHRALDPFSSSPATTDRLYGLWLWIDLELLYKNAASGITGGTRGKYDG
jgi:hypothetical protein